jgi:selenoprotein W-related protein
LVELGSGAHDLQEDHPREIASGVVEMIVGAASAGVPSVGVAVTYCVPCGYERRARDFAVELRKQFSVEAKLVPGKGGVFRVTIGERVLAARTKIHFPSTGELIEAVRQALLDSEGGWISADETGLCPG